MTPPTTTTATRTTTTAAAAAPSRQLPDPPPTCSSPSPAASALASLTCCNLKELHLRRADGSRTLDALHATCRAAGLLPPGTPDASPRERYLAVFDAALNAGLGCWVLDYVEVVCADRHLSSNDPLEAYLLDGSFVKAWAAARLTGTEQAVTEALQSDAALHAFEAGGQLQRQLAQMRLLAAVLRALNRIRTGGGGGGDGVAQQQQQQQDRLSVKAELRQALLLEQGLQVMSWAARQGLAAPRAPTGRFVSYAEWSRAVAARRSRAAPRQLFLDGLLQSLSLSGAYPSASIPHMLHTLLLVVRDVDPAKWASKLALLSYYLMDSGVLDGALGTGPAAAVGTAAGDGSGGGGGGRLEAALNDLRRTFRLTPGEVGGWQCQYLLDCAVPPVTSSVQQQQQQQAAVAVDDPPLARACALLPSYVTSDTSFAFIEALLALGRPDVALAVDRGRVGLGGAGGLAEATAASPPSSSPSPASFGRCATTTTSLPQAMTLLEVRLRCGLMSEAFMMLRQHTAQLEAATAVPGSGAGEQDAAAVHSRALLRRLADWAAEADEAARAAGGSGGWLNRLTELPLNATEERVMVEWLCEAAEAGRPSGALLPLFFLQRGRTGEGVAAWRRWSSRQDALAAAEGTSTSSTSTSRELLSGLVAAALDAAYDSSLPTPLRNADVPTPPAAVGGGAGEAAEAATLPDLAPGQGAVSILAGLVNQTSADQPTAVLPFHGSEPPPLISRVVQLPPPKAAPAAAPAAAATAPAAAQDEAPVAAAAPPPSQPKHALFATALPLLLPSAAPFRTPPTTPGFDAAATATVTARFRPFGGNTLGSGFSFGGATAAGAAAGGGGGGLLFSLGAGAVAAEAAERPPPGAGATAASRGFKRSKPNNWP